MPEIPYLLSPDSLYAVQTAEAGSMHIADISFDLGISTLQVRVENGECLLPDGTRLPVPKIDTSRIDNRSILKYNGREWEKWQYFDSASGKFIKMIHVAPNKPPTVEISGIKMHVTQNGDPDRDTSQKINSAGKIRGRILDTCMGLGYTAIRVAEKPTSEHVFVCEINPVMLKMCRENPWSQQLFVNPKVSVTVMAAQEFIRLLPSGYLAGIIHDPPRFALAPQLYSDAFYQEMYRVLAPHGWVYHYTGDPNRRQRRNSLPEQTRLRLKKAGFRKVNFSYMGVAAQK